MKIYIFVLVLSLLFQSCIFNPEEDNQQLTIQGVIENAEGQKIVLQELTSELVISLDSVILKKDGVFKFFPGLKQKSILLIRVNDHVITLFPDSTETIKITTKLPDLLLNANVTGSIESEDFLKMQNRLKTAALFVDSLGEAWEKQKYLPDNLKIKKQLDKQFNSEWEKQREKQIMFINAHASSLSGMLGLYQTIGNLPLFRIEDETELFLSIGDSLTKAMPQNTHVIKFKSILNRFEKLKQLQELEQNTPENAHKPSH